MDQKPSPLERLARSLGKSKGSYLDPNGVISAEQAASLLERADQLEDPLVRGKF